jgi:peptide deformylase
MKVIKFTQFGNPILRSKAKKVSIQFLKTPKGKTLIKNMIYTIRRKHGIGLAAPQIGKPLQIVVMEIRPTRIRPKQKHKGPIIVINPKITKFSKIKNNDWEGCLSIRGIIAIVPRSKNIVVKYYNENGKKIIEKTNGLWARIFQHEIDHLNGIGFIDRIEDTKSIMTISEYKKRILKKK